MSIQIRNDINLITESIAINEAWQELPREVREDLNTIIAEMQRLDEAPLQPAQIQTVFQQMVANRGEGGDTQKISKKVQAQLTLLFAKITGNPKLKGLLSKVGNAVPIDGIKKMVAKLPEPAGSKATAIVGQIQKGAQAIENDQDVAAFKGLIMTVITIGMGAAGVGGPALLGVIGSAAIFRTVVDSAIKAAAGGTAAEIGKTAGAGLVKGAIAGMAGMALSKLADGFMDSVEVSRDENLASFQADADLPTGDIADSLPDMSPEEVDEFLANLQSEPGAVGDMFADSMDRQIDSILDQANVGPEYAAKLEEILKANTVAGPDGISSSFNGGSSMGVLFNAEEYAEYQSIIANNGGGMDGLFSEAAKEFRAEISAEAGIGVADVAGEFAGDVGDADLATTDFDAPDVSGDVADATAGAGDVAGATGDAVGSTFSNMVYQQTR